MFQRAIVAVSLVLASASSVFAFSSYPRALARIRYTSITSNHDDITIEAMDSQEWPHSSWNAILDAVTVVDWNESEWKGGTTYGPNANYSADHHFDRGPGVNHKDAFLAAAAYMRPQRQEAIDKGIAGDKPAATAALGRTLHALQDFFSHSNWIELCEADQNLCIAAMFGNAGNPPETLKLTAFSPMAADPEKPPGDLYSHGDFCKDTARYNAEAKTVYGTVTKFVHARHWAKHYTERMIQEVRDAIAAAPSPGPGAGARYHESPMDSLYLFQCDVPCGAAGCTLSCGGTTLAIPAGSLGGPDSVAVLGVPANFFFSDDLARTFDGARTFLWREVRLVADTSFSPPALAAVHFPDSVLTGLDASTLAVYRFDDGIDTWTPVSGAAVDADSLVAEFPVEAPGVYAIGALMPGEVVTGACCLPDSSCAVTTADECEVLGGTWLGPDFPCAEEVCAPLPAGGCCKGDTCVVLNAEACPDQCGMYLGDGVFCDPAPCVPTSITASAISGVVVEQLGLAVRLAFLLAPRDDVQGVRVLRADVPGGAGAASTPALLRELHPERGERLEISDRSVVPGLTYEYWVEVRLASGATEASGPWRIRVGGPAVPVLVSVGPNPVAAAGTLRLYAPRQAEAVVRLFSTDGRLVRTIVAPAVGPGMADIVWDGKDEGGRLVASGTYHFALRVDGRDLTGRLTVVR